MKEEESRDKNKNGKECPGEISQALIYKKNTSCYAKLEKQQKQALHGEPVNNLHLYKTALFTGVP